MSPSSPRSVQTEISVAAIRAGVSHNDIGVHLGMSRAAFSRRMTGEVEFRISELRAIALFLEVPLEQLVAPAGPQATA